MAFFHPVTLLAAGLLLALSPILYVWLGNAAVVAWGLTDISVVMIWLWALAGGAFLCGLLIPAPAGPAKPREINVMRLYAVFCAYSALQLVFVAVIDQFLGYLPILRIAGGFDVTAMNKDLGEAGGFFGLYLVLLLPYLGLAAYLISLPVRSPAGRLGKFAIAALAVTLSLIEAKLQSLAILILAICIFWTFRDDGASRIRWRIAYGIMTSVAAAVFLELGGLVNVLRAGDTLTGPALFAGFDWLVRYSLFPFLNFASVLQQVGLVWVANKCYFLSFIIPAFLRLTYCNEGLDFLLPVPSSPSGFLSPPYTSWGVSGLAVFSFASGVAMKITYKRAAGSLPARFLFVLMAWSLVMIGTYNHFLDAYFMYYPAIVFFFVVKLVEERAPALELAFPHLKT